MTDSNNSKRPPYAAYVVRNYEKAGKEESDWMRVGVAWEHKSGNGFDIWLEALPVSGRIVLRRNEPKPQTAA
jgi:hypothetical protein